MKIIFRIGSFAACLLAAVPFTSAVSAPPSPVDQGQQSANGHLTDLMAKIILRDGTTRMVKLEGVGCLQSICSRTAIKAKAKTDSLVRTWIDGLAAIKDTTAADALFVLKDGTSQRMSLLSDFRVLYLANRLGGTEKLDLAKVKAIEFLPSGR